MPTCWHFVRDLIILERRSYVAITAVILQAVIIECVYTVARKSAKQLIAFRSFDEFKLAWRVLYQGAYTKAPWLCKGNLIA